VSLINNAIILHCNEATSDRVNIGSLKKNKKIQRFWDLVTQVVYFSNIMCLNLGTYLANYLSTSLRLILVGQKHLLIIKIIVYSHRSTEI